jgi:Ca2+-binding EF-hand superfamily protein
LNLRARPTAHASLNCANRLVVWQFVAGYAKLCAAEASAPIISARFGISEEDRAELKRDFDEMDADASGSVSSEEVRALLARERGGTAPSEADVDEMMRSFDGNNDGRITFPEYLSALGYADAAAQMEAAQIEPPSAPEPVSRAATSRVLSSAASKEDVIAAYGINEEEYAEMRRDFDEMDANGSGTVTLDEVRASTCK